MESQPLAPRSGANGIREPVRSVFQGLSVHDGASAAFLPDSPATAPKRWAILPIVILTAPRLRALAAAALAIACACDEVPSGAPAAAQAWPTGTVLVLNGDPILETEVDALASIVARIEPHHTLPHLRRIAVTNIVLPLLGARQVAGPERRAAALERARAWRDALAAGTTPPAPVTPPVEEDVEGGFGILGMEVWDWALDAPIGAWSQPIELPGAWRVTQLLERKPALRPADVRLKAKVLTFPWVEGDTLRAEVDAHLDRSKLEFVDATWRDVVPTLWQRRLRGSP